MEVLGLTIEKLFSIGFLTIVLGLILIIIGYGPLICNSIIALVKSEFKKDINLSIIAMKSAYTLVVGGLIVIILGLLYCMGIIPWWNI